MSMDLNLLINGRNRNFPALSAGSPLSELLNELEMKADRIAVEVNGEIAPRKEWPSLLLSEGDKIEIVHFVGGGC